MKRVIRLVEPHYRGNNCGLNLQPGGRIVPLSEEEQRILRDIEANFYEHDPKFVRAVNRADSRFGTLRGIKMPIATFLLGLAMVLGTYHRIWILAALGFVVMVASAGIVVQNISQRITQANNDDDEPDAEGGEAGSRDFDGWPRV